MTPCDVTNRIASRKRRLDMRTALRLVCPLMLICLLLTACETPSNSAPSPLFDQALMMNGHYDLVYPGRN